MTELQPHEYNQLDNEPDDPLRCPSCGSVEFEWEQRQIHDPEEPLDSGAVIWVGFRVCKVCGEEVPDLCPTDED